jgi:hypothetical protein
MNMLKKLMERSETECGFNPDKFAELIIRHAADCVDPTDALGVYSDLREYFYGERKQTFIGVEA